MRNSHLAKYGEGNLPKLPIRRVTALERYDCLHLYSKSLYINGVSALKTGDIYIYILGTLQNSFNWYPKQQVCIGHFSWMTPKHYSTSKNCRFIKHPLKNGGSMIVLFVTPFPMITYITVDVQVSYDPIIGPSRPGQRVV